MKKIIVNQKYNNKKIVNFILDSFPDLNKNILYKSLRQKDVKINGKRISKNEQIYSGDEICLFIDDKFLFKSNFNLDIIFEDENILIINKPNKISVTENSLNEETLTKLVKKQFGKNLEPCHRLDRNTTGLIIFAKNNEALKILLEKFKKHEIEKHYKTTVYGLLTQKHDILKAYLFKDSKKSIVYVSDEPKPNYLKIVTEYTVISENTDQNTTELDVILHTGKTHQIRAHFAHIGHPIIGDGKYGLNEINKKFNKTTQMLSSYKLKFNFSSPSGILEYLNGKIIEL